MPLSRFTTALPQTPAEVFAWHAAPGALQRLVPSWSGVQVVRAAESLTDGSEAELLVPLPGPAGPLHRRWLARHEAVVPGQGFSDVQVHGPFRSWRHDHRFAPGPASESGGTGTLLVDEIAWDPPWGGGLMLGRIEADLARTFAWRHERTRRDLARIAAHHQRPRLTVALSGAGGLLGGALSAFLRTAGHTVRPLVRNPDRHPLPGAVAWDLPHQWIDETALAACDVVIHLAGEPVAQRWTVDSKRRIHDSRVAGTALIAGVLRKRAGRTTALICASGINAWPDTAQDAAAVSDQGPTTWGSGFLPEVVKAWEGAAAPVVDAGIRLVHLRLGMVLDAGGGALAKMLPAFRLGLGGPLGSGRQWVSWIGLDDAVGLFHDAALNPDWSGTYHAVGGPAVPQRAFAAALGNVLNRPACLTTPAAPLRWALGEMATVLLLGGVRADPDRILAQGFKPLDPTVDQALSFALGRPVSGGGC